MFRHGLLAALAFILLAGPMPAAARQDGAALTDRQIEEFLRSARVVKSRETEKGVTASVRATLSDGTLSHDAHIQVVEESKREFRTPQGLEMDFRDNWRFNVAAYRIDRLLGLRLVPVSVERTWKGRRGAFTWWIDDVMMDDGDRVRKSVAAPDQTCWSEQVWLLRVFDQLIDNGDRNPGNLLIGNNWRLWGIDHTRAFRHSRAPRDRANLRGVDREVLRRLSALDFATLKREVGRYIGDADIRALLARRDGIVAHFAGLGDTGLFDRQDPAAGCRIADR